MKRLFIFILIFIESSFATERSILKGYTARSYTSDDLQISSTYFEYRNNRREILWPYSGASEQAFDLGAESTKYDGMFRGEGFSSTKAQLILGSKLSFDEYSYIKFGGHQFSFDSLNTSIMTYEVGHIFKNESFRAHIFLNTDYQFIENAIPAPIEKGLQRSNLQANLEYSGLKDWRFPVRLLSKSIEDGNSATDVTLSALYGKSWPIWFWIGYQVNQLQYKNRDDGYWSPEDFTAHGPTGEISYPLSDWWQVIAGGNYSIIQEDDFEQGTSTYYSAGIEYGKRDEYLVNLSWNSNLSEQASNEWTSKGFVLNFEKSL